MQEPEFSGAWGEGGDPYPPPFFFSRGGVPSSHVPGQQGGHPPPPQVPGRFGPSW